MFDTQRKSCFLLLSLVILLINPGAVTANLEKDASKGVDVERKHSQGNRWALLIGVDQYDQLDRLRYCSKDVLAIGERFVESGFHRDRVIVLHNETKSLSHQPLKGNIEKQLKLVFNSVKPNDLLIVFFSGHGVRLNGKSYLCPYEADLDNPAKTLVSLDDMFSELKKCPAASKLMVIDACQNDVVQHGVKSATSARAVTDFSKALVEMTPKGILLLTSCAPGEKSREATEFEHGVFMYYILEGLRGQADGNKNGTVTLAELFGYASDRTQDYVRVKYKTLQRPALRGEIVDFPLVTVQNKPLRNVALAKNGGKARAISEGTYMGDTQRASEAIDGNGKNGWASQWDMPAWLEVEFDQMYTIEKLGVTWGPNQHDFSISVSEDGKKWHEVVPSRKATQKPHFQNGKWIKGLGFKHEVFKIKPIRAKYARMNITTTTAASSHIFQAIVHEFEAYAR